MNTRTTLLTWSLRRYMQKCLLKNPAFDVPLGNQTRRSVSTPPSKWHGLWEPNDLKLEPDIPELKVLHVQMRGYDYPILESYSKYVHNMMDTMFELDTDAWPTPGKNSEVRTFLPNSSAVNEKYHLTKYERTVMAEDVPTTTIPLLLHFIRRNCPEGVEVSVKEPDPEENEFRFVPDYEVLELQAEREAVEAGKLRKK